MKKQKVQNAAPIIPVYDEDNLPDEQFYPEGLDDPNGPNADAMRATAVGEIIEPEVADSSQDSQANGYDILPEEEDTAETEIPDVQEDGVPQWDVLPEELDTPTNVN